MESKRVLGISLGTRKLGIAVVQGDRVPYFASKAFFGAWSEKKPQRIIALIDRYVSKFQINHIAIKTPRVTVESPKLSALQAIIEQWVIEKGIEIQTYTVTECKQALGLHKRANKEKCMKLLVEQFPPLQSKYEQEMKNKTAHYEKLFEAIAVAHALYQRLRS